MCVCVFVLNSMMCAVYESRDNKRAAAMYNFSSCPSFKKSPRIPTGKMLAVMDSYIIQSSTALCMRKGNQVKQSVQKSTAAATIPLPGYIYPSTRHAW